MRIAITRDVSPSMERCELTHLSRVPIDLELARVQHRAYRDVLTQLGCSVVGLEAGEDLPDSVFVEDTAFVLDEVAVLLRPGAETRRPETVAVMQALKTYRPIVEIPAPGTVDGGDVLRIGKTVFVGRSTRSNASGIAQLQAMIARYGYDVVSVEVSGCLHLKSAVTLISPDTVLLNDAWIQPESFARWQIVHIDPSEAHAANALLVGNDIIYPESFPRTMDRLQTLGLNVHPVDVSELQKAEGAVTCCSIVFDA